MKIFSSKVEFGFSDNKVGNLAFRFGDSESVSAQRKVFFDRENIDPEKSVVMLPEHSSRVVEVTENDLVKGVYKLDDALKCDCIFTREKGLNLMVTVADCIALVLYDRNNELLALLHIGVKNLVLGTVKTAIEELRKSSQKEPDFFATTNPFIKKCCYKFDDIPEHLSNLKDYFLKNSEGYSLDTESVLNDQLLSCGLKQENISINKLCSKCRDFPSHRRSSETGEPESRMLVYARMV